jgi:hypothetical protein
MVLRKDLRGDNDPSRASMLPPSRLMSCGFLLMSMS